MHASISSPNGSVVTFSCDPGYSLHGNTTSQCVSGEWSPSPETVMCVAIDQSEWNFSLYAYNHSICVIGITSASTTAPSTPSPPSPSMTPMSSTAESSGPPVAAIIAPLVVVVATCMIAPTVTVTVLRIVYKYRANKCTLSCINHCFSWHA